MLCEFFCKQLSEQKAGVTMSLFWQYFMVPILVIISVLAVRGFLFNKKTGNKGGIILGGAFTAGTLFVTVLAVYDLFIGLK